ncbi:MAG: hypothetical protein ACSW8B_00570 [bacterium]
MRNISILKESRIFTYLKRIAIICMIVSFSANLFLTSKEAKVNIQIRRIQSEISTLKSDKDALTIQKQDLVSTERINSITAKHGLSHTIDSEASSVHGKSEK